MNLLEQIQAQYSNPIAMSGDHDTDIENRYCIGGAVCMFAGTYYDSGFPANEKVAYALATLNPNLSHTQAEEFSRAIIEFNDSEAFSIAWRIVGNALRA